MNKIIESLNQCARAGYERVSVSELSFATKLPRKTLVKELRKHNLELRENNGEIYVYFRINAPQIEASWLPEPKHNFVVD